MESVKKKKKPKIVKEISVQTDDLVFSGGILNSQQTVSPLSSDHGYVYQSSEYGGKGQQHNNGRFYDAISKVSFDAQSMKELNHYGYNTNEYQQSQGPLKNTEVVDTQASQRVPAYKMMRAEDVRKWVDDQWEHYTEEGAE